MEVKRFVGRSLEEALQKTKEEFGTEAVILYTYAPERNWFQKLFGNQKFIVIAGRNINLITDGSDTEGGERQNGADQLLEEKYAPPGEEANQETTSIAEFLESIREEEESGNGAGTADVEVAVQNRQDNGSTDPDTGSPNPDTTGSSPKEKPGRRGGKSIENIESMLRDLTDLVKHDKLSQANEELFKNYKRMLENNISRVIAMNIVEQLQDEMDPDDLSDRDAVRGGIQNTIREMIPDSNPIEPGVEECNSVAMVGPTGVGKTTTVAKLAGRFVVKENCSVGLLTIDSYRLGAATQLQKVASLLEIPCRTSKNPAQFRKTLSSMTEEHDLVLIDTLGTSQNDEEKIQRLHEFFRARRPDQVHLVLSANSRDEVLLDTIQSFSPLDVDRVIFSKVDEATRLGLIINILNEINTGISYITTGQEIPKDIREAKDEELVEMILGEAEHA